MWRNGGGRGAPSSDRLRRSFDDPSPGGLSHPHLPPRSPPTPSNCSARGRRPTSHPRTRTGSSPPGGSTHVGMIRLAASRHPPGCGGLPGSSKQSFARSEGRPSRCRLPRRPPLAAVNLQRRSPSPPGDPCEQAPRSPRPPRGTWSAPRHRPVPHLAAPGVRTSLAGSTGVAGLADATVAIASLLAPGGGETVGQIDPGATTGGAVTASAITPEAVTLQRPAPALDLPDPDHHPRCDADCHRLTLPWGDHHAAGVNPGSDRGPSRSADPARQPAQRV